MSETSWHDRREWEARLVDGRGITAYQAQCLIEDADSGERAEAVLEALKKTLRSDLGIAIVDSTTDDDEGEIRIDLVRVEEREAAGESVIRE